jgi:glyceraldehyde 3-phosphate dehydrogenase
VGQVLPELDGKLDGVALRVPVVTGSLVDLAVLLDRDVTVAEVNAAFEAATHTDAFAGRLRYEDEAYVSVDVIGESASCVFDSSLTQAAGRFVKIFGWYDNEWGYVCRLVELVKMVGESA